MNTRLKYVKNIDCSEITDCSDGNGKNVAVNQDQHGNLVNYCYKCKKRLKKTSSEPSQGSISTKAILEQHPTKEDSTEPYNGSYQSIPSRGLDRETCEKYGVIFDPTTGKTVFPYGKNSFKTRDKDKNFYWSGSVENKLALFGMDKFSGGRTITITEGEFDALAVSQMMKTHLKIGSQPVVSIRDGCPSALRSIKQAYDYLNSFETIYLCFDNDVPGIRASKEVAQLLPPEKVKVISLPLHKDANEYLINNQSKQFINSWFSAVTYMPDGIINGSSLEDLVFKPLEKPIAYYPWGNLNTLTYGIRASEMVTVCAGSGLGKSLFLKEIIYKILKTNEDDKVGLLFLEESIKRTSLSLMSIDANKPLHLSQDQEISTEEKKLAFESTLGTGRVFLFDSFGSTSVENIINRIRYMAKVLGCKFIFLDHISIVVSAQLEANGSERLAIDELVTKLRMLVEETKIALFIVSHLRRPTGTGLEDGATTSLSLLRGSSSIAGLSDMVIGLERNSQADCSKERHTTRVRVVKNRYSGLTGKACSLHYCQKTGRMSQVFDDIEEEGV